MSVLIGQVSYAPCNELRTKRIEAAHYQIDFMHMLLPTATIVSVAQAYDASDYHPLARYRKYEQPIGAGAARNEILKLFYDSDYDWLLLCDDDTVFYPYYEYQEFIHDIVAHPDKFMEVDAVSALEPEYYAYKKLNFQDKANLTHYKFEPRVLNSGSATSIIRNMKKYYGVELYYPNVDANKGEGREDIEFLIDWLRHGFNWYTMQTMIRKSLCFDKSSIFGADTKARDKILMHDLDVICERYKDYGITRDIKGHITWKNFNERYNKSKKVLYNEREKAIQYDEHTTPKKPKVNNKTLFDIT
jgi:hypothetical protein